jgi:photosystem II stability/assembly factor-like uncharacterized protein
MGKGLRLVLLGTTLAAAAMSAHGAEGYLIRLYYDGAPARLADTSFLPYAVYDDYAVGEVSAGYAAALSARGFRFDVLADDPALKTIWEVTLPTAELPAAADVLLTVSPGHYLLATPPDVEIPAGDRALRLSPLAVDFAARARPPRVIPFTAQNEVADVVAAVNRGRYERTVRDLAAFGTRFSYSSKSKEAADYLAAELAATGLTVKRDRFFGPYLKEVAAAGVNAAWAGGQEGVVARTTNGGRRWEVLDPVGEAEVHSIACASADIAWVGSENGVVWRTTDGGQNWTETTLGGGYVTDLFFLDGRNGWATTSQNDVYRTDDGGATWIKNADVDDWPRGIAFTDAANGILCGSRGYLARTSDGGRTWQRLPSGTAFRLEAVAYRTATEAYAVGEGGTVLRTTDGGGSWSRVDFRTGGYLYDVAFRGGAGVVVGAIGDVWRVGGGAAWEKREAPQFILYSAAMGSAEAIWCGAGAGALLHSGDGGRTWEDQASGADAASPYVWENVWASRPGRGGASGTVLVCAHYDSLSKRSKPGTPDVPAPGADDNASGTAGVLEFARASRGHDYRRDVIYACFTGEEQGLRGAQHLASLLASNGEALIGVLNMDMIAYADALPEDVDVITNYPSTWLAEYFSRATRTYVPNLGVDVNVLPEMWRSDHGPFWQLGYPAILAVEDWDIHYPYYHSANDTPDKLDYNVATALTRSVVAAAASLAAPTSMPVVTTLDAVEVYPNPYKYGTHSGRVYFANLPPHSRVKFYNVAGEFLAEGGNGAEPIWSLELEGKIRPLAASGVLFFIVETPSGEKTTGKLAVIR